MLKGLLSQNTIGISSLVDFNLQLFEHREGSTCSASTLTM